MQSKNGKQTQDWEKRAKRQFLAVMAVILVAVLGFACWKEYSLILPKPINDLARLKEMTAGDFTLSFACHDGSSGLFWQSSLDKEEMEKAKELLDNLSKTKGKTLSASKWNQGEISYPMYAVCVTSEDRPDLQPVLVSWSNGILYTDYCRMFTCEIDFSDFIAAKNVMHQCRVTDDVNVNGMFRNFSIVKTWIRYIVQPESLKCRSIIPGIRFRQIRAMVSSR